MTAAAILEDQVSVSQFGLSYTVRIQVDSRDPVLSADIANAIAAIYLERQVAAKKEAAQEATQWLSDRAADLRQRVETAETEVERARGLLMQGGRLSAPALERQIADLSIRLVGLRADQSEAEARRERFEDLLAGGDAGAAARIVSSAPLDRAMERRDALVQQLDAVIRASGPDSPGASQMRENLKAAEIAVEAAVAEVGRGLDAAVAILDAQIRRQEAQLVELEGELTDQNSRQIDLRALEREAEAQRGVYEAFLNRLTEAREMGGFQQPDAQVTSMAEPPLEPSAPRKAPLVVLAAVFGSAATAGLVLLRSASRPTLRTATAAAAAVGAPALGVVPWFGRTSLGAAGLTRAVGNPPPDVARAVCVVQAALWRGSIAGEPFRVLVTSAVPGEGATALSAMLARTCAKSGLRTLLVDCDPDSGGFLRAQRANPHAVETVETLGADLAIASGEPAETLALVERLQDGYDAVILDARPVLSGDETLALSRRASAVLLAVRASATPRQAVVEAAGDLRRVGAPLAGVVVTRADPDASDGPFSRPGAAATRRGPRRRA
jgi:Mrp family chromosome partitioning ATPase